jgi:hypothetical protein
LILFSGPDELSHYYGYFSRPFWLLELSLMIIFPCDNPGMTLILYPFLRFFA